MTVLSLSDRNKLSLRIASRSVRLSQRPSNLANLSTTDRITWHQATRAWSFLRIVVYRGIK